MGHVCQMAMTCPTVRHLWYFFRGCKDPLHSFLYLQGASMNSITQGIFHQQKTLVLKVHNGVIRRGKSVLVLYIPKIRSVGLFAAAGEVVTHERTDGRTDGKNHRPLLWIESRRCTDLPGYLSRPAFLY